MSRYDRHRALIEEIDFTLADQRHLRAAGLHFVVKHGHHQPGTICLPGETVLGASFWHNYLERPLDLGATLLLVFDCLCRYRRVPLTAPKIAEIMTADLFYLRCAGKARFGTAAGPKFTAASIRVHIARIRRHLARALAEVGGSTDPFSILRCETGDSRVATYRLRATAEFVHFDD